MATPKGSNETKLDDRDVLNCWWPYLLNREMRHVEVVSDEVKMCLTPFSSYVDCHWCCCECIGTLFYKLYRTMFPLSDSEKAKPPFPRSKTWQKIVVALVGILFLIFVISLLVGFKII